MTFERVDLSEDVTLYLGDCLEIIPTLEAGSVDAIITDLPYGTTACAWDSVIPFEPMWEQVKRILKPRGAFVTTASQPFTSLLVCSNLAWFRRSLVWNKGNCQNFMRASREELRFHEDIVIFSENDGTFNPQYTKGEPYVKNNSGVPVNTVKMKKTGGDSTGNLIINHGRRNMTSILHFFRVEGKEHPTQKSLDLYKYLVSAYTNPDELVCDITMGSGTTGVAAVKLGRRFIGIEIDHGYFEIAARRISEALAQPRLFSVEADVAAQQQALFEA